MLWKNSKEGKINCVPASSGSNEAKKVELLCACTHSSFSDFLYETKREVVSVVLNKKRSQMWVLDGKILSLRGNEWESLKSFERESFILILVWGYGRKSQIENLNMKSFDEL